MAAAPPPGARIELDGLLNLRDLGGWSTPDGLVRRGRLYRSDRLHGLTDADLAELDRRSVDTVIDLRHGREVAQHPNRLWSQVRDHVHVPMGGALVEQGSFVERALQGVIERVTDDDVARSYQDMLADHGVDLGRAVEAALAADVALYHCTAGKDRTGLLSMLVLKTLGADDEDVLDDFTLSNRYRSEIRIEQLRPRFADAGLDVENLRPALSAPRPAMEAALAWIGREFATAERYLTEAGGVTEAGPRLRRALLA